MTQPTMAALPDLRRGLGMWSATALVVSNMIGTGIFTSTGFMAGDLGSAGIILLAWLVGAVFAFCGALAYSELAVNHPQSGGEYVYLTKAYGPSWGFMSGWVSFFAGFSAPIAAAALAFSDYLAHFLPILRQSHPAFVLGSGEWTVNVGSAQLIACGLIGFFTLLNCLRIEVVARIQNSLTLVKIAAILGFIILGMAVGHGDWGHFALPAVRTSTTPIAAQFLVSLLWVMVGYSGWNAATYVAGEVKDPEHSLPRALAIGTAVVAVLYLGLNVTFIYATPLESMKGVLRVGALSASALFGPSVAGAFSGLMAIAIMSTVNAMVTAGPRVYYAMAQNRAFPPFAREVSKGSRVPARAVLAQGACAMLMTFTSFPQLVVFIGFTLTVFTTLAVASVFIFRRRGGWRPLGSISFAYPLIPLAYCLLGMGTTIYGLIWQPKASCAALGVIGIGAIVYHFITGRSAAKLESGRASRVIGPTFSRAQPRLKSQGMRKKWLIGLTVIAVIVASYPIWKPFAKRNKWFVVASNVGLDSLRRYGFRSEQIGQSAVISLPESQIPADVKKIQAIYGQYLRYSGWSASAVAGKRILELGPGYTIGVPLMFAADGAGFVAGLDKFVRLQDGPYFIALYTRIREALSNEQRAVFDRAISLRPKLSLNPQFATYIDHKELTDSLQQLGPGSFDLIVSNAVIEEIYDPTAVFKAQGELLRPGGLMVHRIDLRDYGMFSKYGFHALEFLTVPDWIYRRMVEGSGQPDRRLIDYYRELGVHMGFETEIYASKVLGAEFDLPEPRRELRRGIDYSEQQLKTIAEIRPRLLERYRKLSDTDLLVQSIVFVARKPMNGASAN